MQTREVIEPWHLAEGVSVITPDRMKNLVRAVERTRGVPGDMAELGVYRGGSAKVIATVRPEVTLHLFDTFEGLPYTERRDRDPHGLLKQGDFCASEQEVRKYLEGLNVQIHRGFFPQTVWHTWDRCDGPFSFVHIDCDLGTTAEVSIQHFWPRLNPGGVMFFDDYGCAFTGVTGAVDKWLGKIIPLELQYDMYGNQIGALVVKR